MLFWFLILCPLVLLAGAVLWLRPGARAGTSPEEGPVESQLVRLLGLFEQELQRTEGPSQVVGLSSDGKALILSFDHQESVLSLPDLLRFAKVRGHQLHELVEELVVFLQENQSTVGDLPFDLAIPDLLPQIRTMDWIQANSPVFGPGRLLRSTLVEDLRVCFVIDEPETMVFLTEAHLASWGASLDAIQNLAMENLRKKAAGLDSAEAQSTEQAALRIVEDGDGYSATRLLLHLYSSVPSEGLVFGIPDRDKFYIGPHGDLDATWSERLIEDHASGGHPLSPTFFRVEGQQVVSVVARS
jgi:uncharacterized protein YtpQ (UPF0354 family)